MKRILLVVALILLGALVAVPVTARTIEVGMRENVNIYNIPKMDEDTKVGTVSTFDDNGNKCYVALTRTGTSYAGSGGQNVSISCVKQNN